MTNRVQELAARREHLLERSAELRERMAGYGRDIEYSVGRIESAVNTVRSVVTPPLLLTALAGLLIIVKPARLLGFVTRGVMLVATVRRLTGFLRKKKETSASGGWQPSGGWRPSLRRD